MHLKQKKSNWFTLIMNHIGICLVIFRLSKDNTKMVHVFDCNTYTHISFSLMSIPITVIISTPTNGRAVFIYCQTVPFHSFTYLDNVAAIVSASIPSYVRRCRTPGATQAHSFSAGRECRSCGNAAWQNVKNAAQAKTTFVWYRYFSHVTELHNSRRRR